MSEVKRVYKKFISKATDEELHPIMSHQVNSDPDQIQENIVLENIKPTASALKDENGGYIGPQSFNSREFTLPGQTGPSPRQPKQRQSSIHIISNGDDRGGGGTCLGSLSNYWGARSGLEQRLLMVVISLGAAVLVVLVGVSLLVKAASDDPSFFQFLTNSQEEVCSTPECVEAAGEMMSWMDRTVDPCVNFIQYTCGNWRRKFLSPENFNKWDNFVMIRERLAFRLKGLLEMPIKENEPKPIKAAKTFYKACADQASWESQGVKPLLKILDELGNFPLIDSGWDEATFKWVDTLTKLKKMGASSLISVVVSADSLDSTKHRIKIRPGSLPVDKVFLDLNDTSIKDRHVKKIKYFGKILSHHINDLDKTTTLTSGEVQPTQETPFKTTTALPIPASVVTNGDTNVPEQETTPKSNLSSTVEAEGDNPTSSKPVETSKEPLDNKLTTESVDLVASTLKEDFISFKFAEGAPHILNFAEHFDSEWKLVRKDNDDVLYEEDASSEFKSAPDISSDDSYHLPKGVERILPDESLSTSTTEKKFPLEDDILQFTGNQPTCFPWVENRDFGQNSNEKRKEVHSSVGDRNRRRVKRFAKSKSRHTHLRVSKSVKDMQDEDAVEMWNFWVNVSKILPSKEEYLDPYSLHNIMTIEELQIQTNKAVNIVQIDWLKFLNDLFKGTGVVLTKSEELIVEKPEYITKLLQILVKTPKRVIANTLLYEFSYNMGEDVEPSLYDDISYLGRRKGRIWHDCATKTESLLPMAVSALYAQTFFSEDDKKQAEELVKDVRASFKKGLLDNDWMNEDTRLNALDKVNKMLPLVGYPEFVTDKKQLEEYYEELPEVSPNQHFDNAILIQIYNENQNLKKLNKTPERNSWHNGAAVINAYYHLSQNAIILPAGILQPPFFRTNTIKALNYGSLGSIIGHETTHGFDVTGRRRNGDGNLFDWWTGNSSAMYDKKAQCFEDQYNKYGQNSPVFNVPDVKEPIKVNGKITQSENIADNGGVRIAYLAYKDRVDQSSKDQRLIGLETITPEQLFFISFSQIWCSTYTKKGLEYTLRMSAHSPGPLRVFGVMSNTNEFQEAFQCPATANMNNLQKCKLW